VDHGVGLFEGLLHLAIFLSAGLTLAVTAVALLERTSARDGRVVRWSYVAAGAGTLFALLVAERVYHHLQG